MNASILAARTALRMGWPLCAATLAAPCVSAAAFAADADSDTAPWVIDGSQYLPDPSYNNGRYTVDAFAGSESLNYRAKKLVHLDNGDIIVAAIVPPGSGGGSNAINLGLVRYNASGQRIAWSNPTPDYAFFGGQYIVYPNSNDANINDSVSDVKDMKLIGDRIFVLIDHPFAGTADMDSRVVVFDTDGRLLSTNQIVTSTAAEYGGGIVVYSNFQFPETIGLAYAGTTIVSDGTERPTFRRFTVNTDGTLAAATDAVYVTAGDLCDSLHHCELHGIAAGGLAFSSPSRFYLAGTRQYQGEDWDYLLFAVLPSGAGSTSFSDDGARTYAFDLGDNDRDSATAISVVRAVTSSSDQIFLSGEVARECLPGVGIVKFDSDGNSLASFGEVVVGGSDIDNPTTCAVDRQLGSARADYPLASAYADSRLAVSGINVYGPGTLCPIGEPCPEDNVDGELIVVDSNSGAVESFRGYAYSDTVGGARTRHSGLWGIVPSGTGSFTAAGDVRFFQSAAGAPAGPMQVATIRLGAQGDVIFADGFGD
jgi:hypothetical protein